MSIHDPHQLMALADSNGTTPAKEQQAAGVGILLQIMMLVLSFVLGHVLRRHKFYYLPEASASLLIGLIVGGLANISDTETSIRAWFNFHEEFFILFLLPPIIFQSGFSLSHKPFFSNFGAIVTFAILGTFIASVVTGVLVYLGGLMYLTYRLPFVECLMFGALISATDPVTVLSIFQELGTDTNLYALMFGESVLNDAMAESLYRTMSLVRSHASSGENFFMVIVRGACMCTLDMPGVPACVPRGTWSVPRGAPLNIDSTRMYHKKNRAKVRDDIVMDSSVQVVVQIPNTPVKREGLNKQSVAEECDIDDQFVNGFIAPRENCAREDREALAFNLMSSESYSDTVIPESDSIEGSFMLVSSQPESMSQCKSFIL
ncbi:hypothetical protein ACLB2K_024538 [Fragaria x ananassa]